MSTDLNKGPFWILRDPHRCSGCRLCEVACTLRHEGKVWPEVSRIRILEPFPGIDIPHLCAQCPDYPCVKACPLKALKVHPETGAVTVDEGKCNGCGECFRACPGGVPILHPEKKKALICDLCGGDPECVKICALTGHHALRLIPAKDRDLYRLYALNPEEQAKRLYETYYGEEVP